MKKKNRLLLVIIISTLLLSCSLFSGGEKPTSSDSGDPPPAEAVGNPSDTTALPTFTKVIPTIALPTNTLIPSPTLTATPDFSGFVIGDGVNIRKGPDTVYDAVKSYEKDTPVTITGKNSSCSWLAVDLPDGNSGWIRADLISYTVSCSLLKVPAIPPTPSPLPYVPPTPTACAGATVNVTIINNTGGTVTLNLRGPCTYTKYVPTGKSTIAVIPGTYSYTAYGCGGATLSGSQKLDGSTEWTWFCQ